MGRPKKAAKGNGSRVDDAGSANDEQDLGEPRTWIPDAPDLAQLDATVGAVVTHVLARPDGIRARAQVSASISAAAAAALAAFGGLTGLSERADWLRWLVTAAVAAWLVSLGLYLEAIAKSYGRMESPSIKDMLEQFQDYAVKVRSAVKRGTRATIVAILVTVAAAGALAYDGIVVGPERPFAVILADDASAALTPLCGRELGPRVGAEIAPKDLARATIRLSLNSEQCPSIDQDLTVYLRRSWILAAHERD